MNLQTQKSGVRKFHDIGVYNRQEYNNYFLLPFRFHRLNEEKEIIVNEVGDFLVLPLGTVSKIINKELNKDLDFELYGDLISNLFISETKIPHLIDVYATRYRTKKSFLDCSRIFHGFSSIISSITLSKYSLKNTIEVISSVFNSFIKS